MNFPKLKNALLCRILVYVVVFAMFLLPVVIVFSLPFIPESVKAIVGFASMIGLVIFILKNLVILMMTDFFLAALHSRNTARKQFKLPKDFSVKKSEKKLSHFGKSYNPTPKSPSPDMLRYKSKASMTVYCRGIEKVVATYHIDMLDKNLYRQILNSAVANSNALKDKKKQILLDKNQKKSPLNRVTVIIIYADRLEEDLRENLFKKVCQNNGDDYDTSVLPCVIDLEKQSCTFNSERIPYIGFQYAVKNRGIKIIRKYIFNNRFTLAESPDMLDPIKDTDTEQSLWDFWKTTKKEMISDVKKTKKQFEKMKHREIIFKDDWIYLKWNERGIQLPVELNEELKTAEIDTPDLWDYPKSRKITKEIIEDLEKLINLYFAELGYTVKYINHE